MILNNLCVDSRRPGCRKSKPKLSFVLFRSHTEFATKHGIERLELKMDSRFALVDRKFDKLSWMMGILIAIALANFAKQFF